MAAAVAQLRVTPLRPESSMLHVVDLRVDYDFRRQGLATAMLGPILPLIAPRSIWPNAGKAAAPSNMAHNTPQPSNLRFFIS